MKYLPSSAVIALTLCPVSSARADEVSLVAPGGIRAAIEKMIPDFEKRTGHKALLIKVAVFSRRCEGVQSIRDAD